MLYARPMRPLALRGTALSLLLLASLASASADSLVPESPGSTTTSAPPSVGLFARIGIDGGYYGLRTPIGIDALARVYGGLFVGGSFELGTRVGGLSGTAPLPYGGDVTRARLGGRAELHSPHAGWFDPWVGAYAGALLVSRRATEMTPTGGPRVTTFDGEIRAAAGCDVRRTFGTTRVSLGPVGTYGTAGGEQARAFVGLRLGVAF